MSVHELTLTSFAQPIWSVPHGRVVGWEALLRVQDGARVVPPLIYLAAEGDDEAALARELAARLRHLGVWSRLRFEATWLFLNVSPHAIRHDVADPDNFTVLLRQLAIPPETLVLELLEAAIDDLTVVRQAVDLYHALGCLVALDDFGAGSSNLERLFVLEPDIVKIDRSLLVRAGERRSLQRSLRHLVGFIHAAGALALAEGVEHSDEAQRALDAGVDLVQGYRYGVPAPWEHWLCEGAAREQEWLLSDRDRLPDPVVPPSLFDWFAEIVTRWARGEPLGAWVCHSAPEPLLRLYCLNRHGMQLGATIHCRWRRPLDPVRYAPLEAGEGASWAHRSYFRSAIARPGQIVASEPYLALPDRDWEVTLACARRDGGAVLCADVAVDES
ncbi:MAG TPA: diguanylate phosphodiesterase [Rhodocyclaceae bacterium]|nr:diguanylate phosphodiesterase [Rhodocyclaceae bacterium]